MPGDPGRLSQFWKELKRRKVVRVITAYAAAAYVIIELINNVMGPLNLPDWTATLVIIILVAGFPIVIILSWIFDVTPKGLKKTGIVEEEQALSEDGHKEKKWKLKASDIIIALLLVAVCFLLYPKIFVKDSFKDIRNPEGKISVAVMPFDNLTGDSRYDGMEIGIQNLIVSRLSNVEELTVKQTQTFLDISMNQQTVNNASITSEIATERAKQINASTALLGSLLKSGQNLRLTANLLQAETGEIFKSFELEVNSDDALFTLTDSLTFLVTNYFQIRDLENQVDNDTRLFSNTDIAGAYRFFSKGTEKFYSFEFQQALNYLEKALELDPDFTVARFFKYLTHWNMGNGDVARQIVEEMYARIEEDDYLDQLYVHYVKSLFDKDLSESEKYLNLILDEVPYSRGWNYETGRFYKQTGRYRDALPYLEKALDIDKNWGTNWKFIGLYANLGDVYRVIGQLQKEEETYKKGLNILPDHPILLSHLAENAFLQGQDDKAKDYITRYKSIREARSDQASFIGIGIGEIYMQADRNDDAERIYRDIIASGQDFQWVKSELAYLLFRQEKNLEEGMEFINEVLEIEPESSYLLRIKGLGLYKMQEYNAAVNVLTKAFELEYIYINETFHLLQKAKEALQPQGIN